SLRVTNVGPRPIADVNLRNVVRTHLSVAPGSIAAGGACSGNCSVASVLSWPALTLAPGESDEVTFDGQTTGPAGSLAHMTAEVSLPGGSTMTRGIDLSVGE